ncbi:MAG TPA: hypothetical protein VNE39_25385 [Planctomycetota bacterium]|nr:hypothetical protein [Planctomycetota bacterium]
MARSRIPRSIVLLAALGAGLCGTPGCTNLGRRAKHFPHAIGLYFQDRFEDLTEVADLGFTFTLKSGYVLYVSAGSLVPVGGGYFNGWFLGFGGGQVFGIGHSRFLVTRHYFAGGGVGVWGYEEIGWDEYDTEDLSSFHCQDVGAGLFVEPYGRPGPFPSFRNQLHAGYIGIVANAHVYETLDFLLGFLGFDLSGDDGVRLGKWSWQTYEEADVNSFEFNDYHMGFQDY